MVTHIRLAVFLFLLLPALLNAATVTGMVQRVDGTWARNSTVYLFPSNTPAVLNNNFNVSTSIKFPVNNNGWISNMVGVGNYRFSIDLSTRDTGMVWVPDDDNTYNLWSLITSGNVNYNSNVVIGIDYIFARRTNALQRILTNGVLLAGPGVTNIDFVSGVTGFVSGATAKLGVNAAGGGGGGDITAGANLGAGLNTYDSKSGSTLRFNTISNAGDGTLVASNSHLFTINLDWLRVSSQTNLVAASNVLYGLIINAGISAATATNIAQYFATNSAIVTSNQLVTMIGLANSYTLAVSNIAVAGSNALRSDLASAIGYTLAVSNIAYTASNGLRTDLTAAIAYTLGVSNIAVTASNVLRTDITASVAYTLAVSNISVTASNSLRTDLIAAIAYTLSVSNASWTASNYLFGIIGGAAGVTNTLINRITSARFPGDMTIAIDSSSFAGINSKAGYFVIGAFTTNCELRRVATISGNSVTFNAPLVWPHAVAEKVIFASGDAMYWWWAPNANVTSDDTMTAWKAMQETAAVQAGTVNVWLEGGGVTSGIKAGITALHDVRVRRLNLTAISGYASNGTNDWMLRFAQGERYAVKFSNNFIYPLGGWAAPSQGATDPTNSPVTFFGTNLPPEIVMGSTYFIADVDTQKTNWFKIAVDTNKVVLALSAAAGTNFVYTEVDSLTRSFLEDVYVKGGNIAHNGLNGNMQQPAYWKKIRLNEMGGAGQAIHLDGQEFEVDKLEVGNCDVGLYLGGLKLTIKHLNIESWSNAVLVTGTENIVDGYHFEGALSSGSVGFDMTGARIPGGTNNTSSTPIDFIARSGVVANSAGHPQIVFDASNPLSSASYDIQSCYLSSMNLDAGDIGLRDNLRGHLIWANSSTSNHFNRIIGHLHAPHLPDNSTIDDSYSGNLVLGMGGKAFHVGSQWGAKPFLWGKIGIGDTGPWLQVRGSNNASSVNFPAAGGLYVSNAVANLGGGIIVGTASTPGQVLTYSDAFGTITASNVGPTTASSANYDNVTVTNQLRVGNLAVWPDAAAFDGSTAYLNRGADMTGTADGTNGTISVWFKHGVNGIEEFIIGSANYGEHLYAYIGADNKFCVDGYTNSPAGIGLRIKSATAYTDGAWHHAMASWSMRDTAKRHLYIDNTNDLSVVVYNPTVLDYTASDWTIGSRGDAFSKWTGSISEPMLWLATYTDLSVATNRAALISNGKVVDPGVTGTALNGVQPILYLRVWTGVNAGSGGTFTINGLPTVATPPLAASQWMQLIQIPTPNTNGLKVTAAAGQYADLATFNNGTNAVSGVLSNGYFYGNGSLLTGIGGSTPAITSPVYVGTGPPKLIVDGAVPMVKWSSTGDVFYAQCTNGTANIEEPVVHWIYGGATNRSIVLVSGWTNNLFGCTQTNTLISNRWTVVYFSVQGTTADANGQTNVFVKLEAQ